MVCWGAHGKQEEELQEPFGVSEEEVPGCGKEENDEQEVVSAEEGRRAKEDSGGQEGRGPAEEGEGSTEQAPEGGEEAARVRGKAGRRSKA